MIFEKHICDHSQQNRGVKWIKKKKFDILVAFINYVNFDISVQNYECVRHKCALSAIYKVHLLHNQYGS